MKDPWRVDELKKVKGEWKYLSEPVTQMETQSFDAKCKTK
jgi:transposase-like protein